MTESDPGYERGYLAQGEWLDKQGMTEAEAEHVLAERLSTVDRRNSFNRGGDDATRDYVVRMRASRNASRD